MTDFLDEKKKEISDRLKELKPLVEEYQRLEAAAGALDGVGNGAARVPRRGPGRPRSSGGARTARRPGRRRGTGTRGAEALKLVRAQPGITIPQLAERMGIKQNYLYRVLPSLEQDGQVKKQGRGWHPRNS